jgi:hypothetical protein
MARTDGDQNVTLTDAEVKLVDSSGNDIASELQTDGDYHLGTTITQSVYAPAGNSSNTNLAAGATWAGTPVSTLGVVGLQWNLNTDQNCTIYSEESEGSHTGVGTVATSETTTLTGTSTTFERSFVVGDTISVSGETDRVVATIVSDTELTVTVAFDNTDTGLAYTHYHWDISYSFDFLTNGGTGEGETVQATMAYWRLRVVNEGSATTTYFRVSGVLCPIATPLPSSLSHDRRLKSESTLVGSQNENRHVWVNPTNEMAISPVYRMVGTAFDGSTLDDNFWSDDECLRDGTVTQGAGEIKLLTNTTANGLSILQSVRKGRFVAGSAMIFEGAWSFKTAATANNTRRVGAYTLDGSLDVEDGFFFQLAGTTFSLGYARDGSVTTVDTGSFNGKHGLTWTPTADTYYKFSIEYAPMGAFWYVDGVLLHKVKAGHPSAYMTLPITMENENTGNITTEIELHCVGAYIARQGELFTNQTSKFLQGTGTTVCKYGAGVVKGIVISAVVDNTEIDFYDGTNILGDTLLWASGGIQAKTDYEPIPVDLFGLPFSDGLTIEISEENCNVLVIYE